MIAEEAGLVVRGLDEARPNLRMVLAGSEEIVAQLSELIRPYVPD